MDSIVFYREFTTGFRAGARLMRETNEGITDPLPLCAAAAYKVVVDSIPTPAVSNVL